MIISFLERSFHSCNYKTVPLEIGCLLPILNTTFNPGLCMGWQYLMNISFLKRSFYPHDYKTIPLEMPIKWVAYCLFKYNSLLALIWLTVSKSDAALSPGIKLGGFYSLVLQPCWLSLVFYGIWVSSLTEVCSLERIHFSMQYFSTLQTQSVHLAIPIIWICNVVLDVAITDERKCWILPLLMNSIIVCFVLISFFSLSLLEFCTRITCSIFRQLHFCDDIALLLRFTFHAWCLKHYYSHDWWLFYWQFPCSSFR